MQGFKKFLVAGISAGAMVFGNATFVAAADLYTPVSQFAWDGFYVGGAVGYAWPKSRNSDFGCDSILITDTAGTPGPRVPGTGCAEYSNGGAVFDGIVGDGPNTGNTYPAFEFPQGDYVTLQGTQYDNNDGLIGGLIAGGNIQQGNFVFGLEADFSWTDVKREAVSEFGHFGTVDSEAAGNLTQHFGEGRIAVKDEMDWLSTIRARAGYVFGEEGRMMAYGSGGLAFARVSRTVVTEYDETGYNKPANPGGPNKCGIGEPAECVFGDSSGNDTFNQYGFTVGAGLDYAWTDNIIVGAEYLYTGLFAHNDGKVSTSFVGDNGRAMDIDYEDDGFKSVQQIRARIAFKF